MFSGDLIKQNCVVPATIAGVDRFYFNSMVCLLIYVTLLMLCENPIWFDGVMNMCLDFYFFSWTHNQEIPADIPLSMSTPICYQNMVLKCIGIKFGDT